MHIIDACTSPKVFGPLFKDLSTWGNWQICLKAIFGLQMTDLEHEIYREFTGRTDHPSKQFKETFLIIGRQAGKSFISALVAVFLAVFRLWDLGLSCGHILVVAVDKAQAQIVFRYVKQILQLPIFKSMIVAERAEEIELSNGMIIGVHACSFRSLRGYRICAAILDELAFFRVEGSNPAAEILTAVRPALGNVKNSLLLGISSSYAMRGVLYETFKDKYAKNDPESLVWRASTAAMNPTFPKDVIDRFSQSDPAAARAEYFSEFRADLESFLTTSELEGAVVPDRHVLPPQPNIYYFGFCDPSGGRQDAMTLSICHSEGQTIIQDCLQIRKPPFNPDTVVQEFAAILKSYNVHVIEGDRYAAQWIVSAFANHGIFYETAALTKSDVYLNARAVFSTGRIELLDNGQQTAELRQLERRTGQQKDTVNHPPGLHDDAANAICGAIVMAARSEALRTPPPSRGIIEEVEDEKARMDREATRWLLGLPQRKKKQNPDEVDMEAIEDEIAQWEEEFEMEKAKKDTAKDVVFKRGW